MSDTTLEAPSLLAKTNVGTAILASIITSVVIVGGIVWSDATNKQQVQTNTSEIQKLRENAATKADLLQLSQGQNRIESKVDALNTYLLNQPKRK